LIHQHTKSQNMRLIIDGFAILGDGFASRFDVLLSASALSEGYLLSTIGEKITKPSRWFKYQHTLQPTDQTENLDV